LIYGNHLYNYYAFLWEVTRELPRYEKRKPYACRFDPDTQLLSLEDPNPDIAYCHKSDPNCGFFGVDMT